MGSIPCSGRRMKRFTETDKWRDKWFRRLSPEQKLVFIYILENCDNAGFLELDDELIAFETGIDLSTIEGAIKGLSRAFDQVGDVIWVKNFLRHQKNLPLNPNNKAHSQIIGFIKSRGSELNESFALLPLDEKGDSSVAPSKPLARGVGIGIGIGLGKGQGGV